MIREVEREDYPTIARFWREYLDVPAATDESVTKTIEKMKEDDRYCTYVAVEDGKAVGFITLVEVLSMDDPNCYIKMNGIAVSSEYRRRGIAQQLIQRAEEFGRERGADSIGAATSFKRIESQTMFAKLGYDKSAFWFHKALR